jgi:hypothetical protein
MIHTTKIAVTAGAIAFAVVAVAGSANAAPSRQQAASDAVNTLRAQGFHVILSKTGTAPLDQCAVTSMRPGQTFERNDSGAAGAGSGIVTTVMDKTVYVDVDC